MINLTPIAENIQRRLFQKQNILARQQDVGTSVSEQLSFEKLSSKSVWLRMTSGLSTPVTLQGGLLNDDKTIRSGFEQLYPAADGRPIPGLISLQVDYLGGNMLTRGAEINWVCWSFDQIKALTPHFLSLGSTVMIEWGWVYDEKTLINLPSFLNSDGTIRGNAYTDYKNDIIDANGDFDMVIGVVKNMSWSNRQDGGFECRTSLSSIGVDMLRKPEPPKDKLNTNVLLNISDKEQPEEKKKKLEKAVKEVSDQTSSEVESSSTNVAVSRDAQLDLIFSNDVTLTPNIMIRHIDRYVRDQMSEKKDDSADPIRIIKTENMVKTGNRNDPKILWEPNRYILEYTQGSLRDKTIKDVNNVWVRWGWFEDNILSKFLTMVSDKSDEAAPIAQFRSVEKLIGSDGKEVKNAFDENVYESTRIRNHPNFDTIDVNNHILPGQFSPLEKPDESPDVIKGDSEFLVKLKEIVNENFKSFRPETTIEESISYTVQPGDTLGKIAGEYGISSDSISQASKLSDPNVLSVGQNLKIPKKTEKDTPDENTGYLRSMLINTKVIKQAFGVLDEEGIAGEVDSIFMGLENMFDILNEDMSFWSLTLATDPVDQNLAKIIDTPVTTPLPETKIKINNSSAGQKTTKSVYDTVNSQIVNNGVYFFPVYQQGSMIKSQNVTMSIPDSLQMSAMYGRNGGKINTLGATPEEVGDESVHAVASLGTDKKNKETKDTRLDGIKIALKKKGYEKYGSKSDITAMIKNGSDDDLGGWAKDNQAFLANSERDRSVKLEADLEASKTVNESSTDINDQTITLDNVLDPSVPPPLPDYLYRDYTDAFKLLGEMSKRKDERGRSKPHPLAILYSSKYDDNRRMKQRFIDSVSLNTAYLKKTKKVKYTDTDKPILVPLNLALEIEGIGGLFPGNSFHSEYLPDEYKEECIFIMSNVSHTVNSSGWTTSIEGLAQTTSERTSKIVEEMSDVDISSIKDQFLSIKSFQDEKESLDEAKEQAASVAGLSVEEKTKILQTKEITTFDENLSIGEIKVKEFDPTAFQNAISEDIGGGTIRADFGQNPLDNLPPNIDKASAYQNNFEQDLEAPAGIKEE